eukprot:131701-Prymnesium_polylepis.1
MIASGVPCCLNGDDPAVFGAPNSHGLVREFQACRDEMGMSDAQLAQLARNSFVHAFCPEYVRVKALADIDAWQRQRAERSGDDPKFKRRAAKPEGPSKCFPCRGQESPAES